MCNEQVSDTTTTTTTTTTIAATHLFLYVCLALWGLITSLQLNSIKLNICSSVEKTLVNLNYWLMSGKDYCCGHVTGQTPVSCLNAAEHTPIHCISLHSLCLLLCFIRSTTFPALVLNPSIYKCGIVQWTIFHESVQRLKTPVLSPVSVCWMIKWNNIDPYMSNSCSNDMHESAKQRNGDVASFVPTTAARPAHMSNVPR